MQKKLVRWPAGEAATITGQLPVFIEAIANEESSFLPTNESQEDFVYNGGQNPPYMGDVNWTITPGYPNETLDIDASNGTIIFRGQKRVIRRAQGLMMLIAPGYVEVARDRLGTDNIEQIVSLLRSPLGNATLGAETLARHKLSIVSNSAYYNELKEIVKANPAFAHMQADSGIPAIDLALSGCAAYMYNKGAYGAADSAGKDNTQRIIRQMANIKYDGETAYYNEGAKRQKTDEHGYSHRVITYMIQNTTKQAK